MLAIMTWHLNNEYDGEDKNSEAVGYQENVD